MADVLPDASQNVVFLACVSPWISKNIIHAAGIPVDLLHSQNKQFTVAIFFSFAACFVAIGLWMTIVEGEEIGDESSKMGDMNGLEELIQKTVEA